MATPDASPMKRLSHLYDGLVLDHPRVVLALLLLVSLLAAVSARQFRLDASADALTLENDQALAYFREIDQRYGGNDFLVIAYQPNSGELLTKNTLDDLDSLAGDLRRVRGVASVLTVLDVPLLRSPPVPLSELASNIRTLKSPDTDLTLAAKELRDSPLYHELLVSPDLKTTAIQINLTGDARYDALRKRRDRLRQLLAEGTPDAALQRELALVTTAYRAAKDAHAARRHRLVDEIRQIMAAHGDQAQLHLGGVAMIADDMLSYVRSDIRTFGVGVLLFIVLALGAIFRRPRWVLLPLLNCAATILLMVGLLGWLHWPATVISANFIALLLIITLSITLHIMVRYRQRAANHPLASQRELVREAMHNMARPSVYATLTTMVGFASLVVSDIRPVIDFGLMMSCGIAIGLLVVFTLLPALLVQLPREAAASERRAGHPLTAALARFADRHPLLLYGLAAATALFTATGMQRLEVENSFVGYFKAGTPIHDGMRLIDRQLGGTTPLDVVFHFPDPQQQAQGPDNETATAKPADDPDAFDNEFDDEFADEFGAGQQDDALWFTQEKMARIGQVHDYLEQLPGVGKVLSLHTMMRIAESFNDGQPLSNLALALLYKKIPEDLRGLVIAPYVSVARNEARITLRIRDSEPGLHRHQLLQQIDHDLQNRLGLPAGSYHLSNMLVLYDNMLQSLYRSQIKSLGLVFLGIMGMFLVLFRSLRIAVIAIIPNLLAASLVLGIMGWAGIPLDMMTITIAAITIGIAVDDTIHYIARFGEEFPRLGSYRKTLYRCHATIGQSMYYTSLTIIAGFTILVASNFIPTIYFGLLTGVAMAAALLGALTLLPRLILLGKPFGPEANG